jgi:hypothetical protein
MKRIFAHLFEPTKKLLRIDQCALCDFKLDEFKRQLQRVKEDAVSNLDSSTKAVETPEDGEFIEQSEFIEEGELPEEGECLEKDECFVQTAQAIFKPIDLLTTEEASIQKVSLEHDGLEEGEMQEEEFEQVKIHKDQGYNSDTTDAKDHEMQYLTPEMIEIFRASEIFRMSRKEEEKAHINGTFKLTEIEMDIDESNIYTKDLKLLLEKRFEEGNRRKPVLWPVMAISF